MLSNLQSSAAAAGPLSCSFQNKSQQGLLLPIIIRVCLLPMKARTSPLAAPFVQDGYIFLLDTGAFRGYIGPKTQLVFEQLCDFRLQDICVYHRCGSVASSSNTHSCHR